MIYPPEDSTKEQFLGSIFPNNVRFKTHLNGTSEQIPKYDIKTLFSPNSIFSFLQDKLF